MERRSFFQAIVGATGAAGAAAAAAAEPTKPEALSLKLNLDTSQAEADLRRIQEQLGGFPFRLEKGGIYVIECEHHLPGAACEALQREAKLVGDRLGLEFIILQGGLRIARQQPPVSITINAGSGDGATVARGIADALKSAGIQT